MIVVLQHIANWPIFVYGLLAITVCSQIVAGGLTTLEPDLRTKKAVDTDIDIRPADLDPLDWTEELISVG